MLSFKEQRLRCREPAAEEPGGRNGSGGAAAAADPPFPWEGLLMDGEFRIDNNDTGSGGRFVDLEVGVAYDAEIADDDCFLKKAKPGGVSDDCHNYYLDYSEETLGNDGAPDNADKTEQVSFRGARGRLELHREEHVRVPKTFLWEKDPETGKVVDYSWRTDGEPRTVVSTAARFVPTDASWLGERGLTHLRGVAIDLVHCDPELILRGVFPSETLTTTFVQSSSARTTTPTRSASS